MLSSNFHFCRQEIKYLIKEEISLEIMEDLKFFMNQDFYMGEKGFYTCHSLYFDTETLGFYRDAVEKKQPREKIRTRHYEDYEGLGKDLFLEKKQKNKKLITKDREIVDLGDLDGLCLDLGKIGLFPQIWVHYERRAFFGKQDESFRITFDQGLVFSVFKDLKKRLWERRGTAILEIKFSEKIPDWFEKIVKKYKLEPASISKYVEGMRLLGLEKRIDRG